MSSDKSDPTRPSPNRSDDDHPDDERYGTFEIGSSTTVLYDTQNERAWIQSDVVEALDAQR